MVLLMTKEKRIKETLALFIILMLIFCGEAYGADSATFGQRSIHATPYSIGIEWPLVGDDNHSADCQVRYRVQGDAHWNSFLPLFRVDNGTVNTLAGSILFLRPQTTYEVNLILSDLDGGSADTVETITTRTIPCLPAGGRTFHVIPGAGGGVGSADDPFQGIATAQAVATPGDIFWVHAGEYPGEVTFSASGQMDNHVVWKAAGDGEALIGRIRVSGDYIWLEGLTVRDQDNALLTYSAPDGVVVTRNYFFNNHYAVRLNHGGSNWHITDNTIIGDQIPGNCSGDACFSGEGVELEHTSGHVVAYNSISNVADGISYPHANCDIFNNELFDLADDGIEIDYGNANNRVWQNRISNPKNNGISFQPMSGAPWYVLRNQVAAPLESALKLRDGDRGLIAHNTLVGWSGAVASGSGYLNRFQCNNNLWISMQDRYCWEDSSDDGFIPFWGENLDYDGFDWGAYQYALKWKGVRYADLDAFFNATGLESHGVHVNKATCFESLNIPSAPPAAMPFQYLTLNPDGNAVDAGTLLAGINDDYVGGAPDLGAYEVGAALPYFGVRVIDFDADGDTDGADLAELTGQSTGLDIRVESFAGRFGSQVKMLPADG